MTGDRDPRRAHDYAQLVKLYGESPESMQGRHTRLTNAFSKKAEKHMHMVALYTVWFNYVRIYNALKMATAMVAGISDRLWSTEDVIALIDTRSVKADLGDRIVG